MHLTSMATAKPETTTGDAEILLLATEPSTEPLLNVISFETQEVRQSSKPQPQTWKIVDFPLAYASNPSLVVGLNAFDLKNSPNVRIRAHVDDVDNQKCRACIDTWGNTTLYSAGMHALILKQEDMRIQAGEVSTQDSHTWNQPRSRTSQSVKFKAPYTAPPTVVCFIKAFDVGSGSSTRLKVWASHITTDGFIIHIDTWNDTTLHCAIASWVAYSSDLNNITSGTGNTIDVRPLQDSQVSSKRDVNFSGVSFAKQPSAFVALNSIDICNSANLRVRTYVDNVTTGGLRWHIDSWHDTKIWSASISYIAFT